MGGLREAAVAVSAVGGTRAAPGGGGYRTLLLISARPKPNLSRCREPGARRPERRARCAATGAG